MFSIKIVNTDGANRSIPKGALIIIPCKFHGSSRYEVLSILKNGNSPVYSYFLKLLKDGSIENGTEKVLYVTDIPGQSNPIFFIFTSIGPSKSKHSPEDIINSIRNGLNNLVHMRNTTDINYSDMWIYNNTSVMYKIPWDNIKQQIEDMKIMADDNKNMPNDDNDIMTINAISII